MRCTSLTALFFALFALFSTLAYAAPVAPEGAVVKRQGCMGPLCREATPPPSTSDSDSTDSATIISNIVVQLVALLSNGTST